MRGGVVAIDGSDAGGQMSTVAVVNLSVAPVPLQIGLGFCGWGVWRRSEPRTERPSPYSYLL